MRKLAALNAPKYKSARAKTLYRVALRVMTIKIRLSYNKPTIKHPRRLPSWTNTCRSKNTRRPKSNKIRKLCTGSSHKRDLRSGRWKFNERVKQWTKIFHIQSRSLQSIKIIQRLIKITSLCNNRRYKSSCIKLGRLKSLIIKDQVSSLAKSRMTQKSRRISSGWPKMFKLLLTCTTIFNLRWWMQAWSIKPKSWLQINLRCKATTRTCKTGSIRKLNWTKSSKKYFAPDTSTQRLDREQMNRNTCLLAVTRQG